MDTYTELIETKQRLLTQARGDKDNPGNLTRRIDENSASITRILIDSQETVAALSAENDELKHRLDNLPEIIADLCDDVAALQVKKKSESPAAKHLAKLIAQYKDLVNNEEN